MRTSRIGMILMVGGLLLSGAALAQSPDDEEQDTSETVITSPSGETALAQSPDDEEQGRSYRAPGVQVWMGRLPSKEERRSAVAQGRSQAKSLAPSVSGGPDFQNERVRVYIGKLPKPGGR